MRNAYSGVLALTAMHLLMQRQGEQQEQRGETPRKIHHEWDNISLSKSERRGKTYEEIQELRKSKYEAMKDDADNDKHLP